MPNGIVPTIKMSMELTKVLADIEMNGLHINTDTLTLSLIHISEPTRPY